MTSGYSGKRLGIILALLAAAVVCFTACSDTASDSVSAAPVDGDAATAAASDAELSGPLYADIDIADYGTVTVELDPSAAPVTVANFVKLANEGFYDGLTFHRIIDGFMMQGGDPTGTGSGGSDETIVGEFSENGYDNPISHVYERFCSHRSHRLFSKRR